MDFIILGVSTWYYRSASKPPTLLLKSLFYFIYLELKLSLSLGLMKLMYVAFLPTVHQRMTIWVNPDSLCKLPKHKPYGVWLLNPCTLL